MNNMTAGDYLGATVSILALVGVICGVVASVLDERKHRP